jgi:hypothetical protein
MGKDVKRLNEMKDNEPGTGCPAALMSLAFIAGWGLSGVPMGSFFVMTSERNFKRQVFSPTEVRVLVLADVVRAAVFVTGLLGLAAGKIESVGDAGYLLAGLGVACAVEWGMLGLKALTLIEEGESFK